MRRAEGVVHVDVREPRELHREARVVLLLLGMEAEILQQHDVARLHRRHHALGRRADAVRRQHDPSPELARQRVRDRLQRQLRLHLALRSAEVRGDDELALALEDHSAASAASP